MSFTFSIPTWKQISSWISLLVVGYASLVSPQYDWLVFGIIYFLGICIAMRSWYREKLRVWAKHNRGKDGDWFCLFVPKMLACILWPLMIPIFFVIFVATFKNDIKAG